MKFRVFTIFPEMFPASLQYSLAGKALEKQLWQLEVVNLRDYGTGKHKNVDDTPYGGGAGMVMRADVIGNALADKTGSNDDILYMSPRGQVLKQTTVREYASSPSTINIICGRFEGIDQRVIDHFNIKEISIGDYVLSGGEPAAIILMDSIVRVIPGVLGNEETHDTESHEGHGLLEHNHYTRPEIWQGHEVPNILRSGNHGEVEKYRQKQRLEITKKQRPDLLKK